MLMDLMNSLRDESQISCTYIKTSHHWNYLFDEKTQIGTNLVENVCFLCFTVEKESVKKQPGHFPKQTINHKIISIYFGRQSVQQEL